MCPGAIFVWAILRDGLGWKDVPKSVGDFKENFITSRGCKRVGIVWFLFGAVCWTLWLNRNDFIFNNKIISSPRALIFCLISLLRHWVVMSTCVDKVALELMVEEIKAHAPEELVATGVG
jgi:hypothetical protein